MGGYLTQTVGFKYSFVVSSSLCGFAFVIALLFMKETYGPVVHRQVLARESLSKLEEKPPRDLELPESQVDPTRFIIESMVRPIRLLTGSLVCFIFSLYAAMYVGSILLYVLC